MADDNQFFRPIRDFCRREVVSCAPQDALVDTVATMRARNISSIVVCDDGNPVGIFTDRDLRNKVVAEGRSPESLRVADIMNSPLAVISEDEVLYRALYQMSRRGIHRLGVVDRSGKLAGIITDTDILRLQAHSPHQLVLDIEKAASLDDLKVLHHRIQALVLHMTGTSIEIRELVKLIAHLNDQVLIRLIKLLREEKYPDLPADFAFVVMGSEGRSEQTLSTDQDNAIIYSDLLDEAAVARIEVFSVELIDALIGLGVPPCPGGIMAKNATWRRSLKGWKKELDRWLATPSPDNIMMGSMFVDLRILDGDASLEQAVRQHVFERLAEDRGFIMRMAQNMVGFTPPLGWFGKIKVERSGPHKGALDIKKAGIFAITDGVKALALEARKLDGSTHDRIEALTEAGVLKARDARDLMAAFDCLVRLRLRGHVEALREGRQPSNYIRLEQLNLMQQGELRIALESVARFQAFIRHHFNLKLLNG